MRATTTRDWANDWIGNSCVTDIPHGAICVAAVEEVPGLTAA